MIPSRRNILMAGGVVAAGAASGLGYLALNAGDPPEKALPPAPSGRARWSNWSGLQTCDASAVAVPADENELSDLLRNAAGPIRPVGAGHSFTGLVPTEGTVLSLDRLNGIVAHDPATHTATVRAGTRLFALGEQLAAIDQSMEALPDINKQSLAGAISTATHGTGRAFGSLSSAVAGLRLMTPDGRSHECDATKNVELFDAARVSLGSLGVITEIRQQNRAPLRLKRHTWFRPIDEVLAQCDTLSRQHRHFEFYYIPFTGMTYCISHDETDEAETPRGENPENDGNEQLMEMRDWLSWAPLLRRWTARGIIASEPEELTVGAAWKLLSTDRPKRFNEMEFHIPQDALTTALPLVIEAIERHSEVYFPIEVRYIDGDKAWLSPFYERPSCSIAVHMGNTQDHAFFFKEIEPIYRRFGGRPHWGKLHSKIAADFAGLYPRWREFSALRKECDPTGRLLNAHLRAVFGVESA